MSSTKIVVEDIAAAQRRHGLSKLRFPPALERAFEEHYDSGILTGLRTALLLLFGLFVLQGIVAIALSHGLIRPVWISAAAILLLLLSTLHRRFLAAWQPLVVTTFFVIAYQLLSPSGGGAPPSVRGVEAIGTFRANTLLLNELMIIIVGCALTRLRFVWFSVGSLTIMALTGIVAVKAAAVPFSVFLVGTSIFVAPALAGLMFMRYLQECSARGEFLAIHQLDMERADEQRRREQTEGMLHILSQAIGGIVHDLGNPLTAVRTGSETLRYLRREENADEALENDVLEIISEGALMLDYLRLSLLEQTRVLEGKDIPIQRETVSFRSIIEASTHYQKPRLTDVRTVIATGDDIEIMADAMKLISVFMNLLGNALKYSDGEICVRWRQEAGMLVCAVLDRGIVSTGISRSQAEQLFVPFGRLVIHRETAGTGLGLVSAQKIIEAHGGELYIEGFNDGAPASGPFTTAHGSYTSMLETGYHTAFVVACPIASGTEHRHACSLSVESAVMHK